MKKTLTPGKAHNRTETEGSPGNEAPSHPSEIKSKEPRSNKSCRQGETTPKQKERTGQRTVTPQEEGKVKRESRSRRWPAVAVEEGDTGRRAMGEDQAPTRRVKRGGMREENPSIRTNRRTERTRKEEERNPT